MVAFLLLFEVFLADGHLLLDVGIVEDLVAELDPLEDLATLRTRARAAEEHLLNASLASTI
jgi:hypothetical protein